MDEGKDRGDPDMLRSRTRIIVVFLGVLVPLVFLGVLVPLLLVGSLPWGDASTCSDLALKLATAYPTDIPTEASELQTRQVVQARARGTEIASSAQYRRLRSAFHSNAESELRDYLERWHEEIPPQSPDDLSPAQAEVHRLYQAFRMANPALSLPADRGPGAHSADFRPSPSEFMVMKPSIHVACRRELNVARTPTGGANLDNYPMIPSPGDGQHVGLLTDFRPEAPDSTTPLFLTETHDLRLWLAADAARSEGSASTGWEPLGRLTGFSGLFRASLPVVHTVYLNESMDRAVLLYSWSEGGAAIELQKIAGRWELLEPIGGWIY